METLRFTAGIVRSIENEKKQSLLQVVGDESLENIAFLLKKGLFLKSDDEVNRVIDEYLAEDPQNDIYKLYFYVIESIQKAGFFPKALDLAGEYKKKMEELEKKKVETEQELGQTSGN